MNILDFSYKTTFLEREESEGIKGVLILLIMLGHNIPFVNLTDSWMVMVWFYLFHIDSFFLLPFLYSQNLISIKRLWNLVVRFYIPFLTISIPLMLYGIIWGKNLFSIGDYTLVLIGGGSLHLKKIIGVQFLWFLPAMCFTCVIRELFIRTSIVCKNVFILLGCVAIILNFYPQIALPSCMDYLLLGMRFLVIGLLVRCFCEKKLMSIPSLLTILVLGSLGFFLHYRWCIYSFQLGYPLSCTYRFLRLFMAPTFLIFLWSIRSILSKSRFLIFLGKNSFPIYLLHPFIGYFSYLMLKKMGINDLLAAPLCLTIMLLVSSFFASLLNKIKCLHSIFMPRGWNDFILAYKDIWEHCVSLVKL